MLLWRSLKHLVALFKRSPVQMEVVLYFDLRPLRSTLSKAFWASFNTESLNVVWQNDRRVLLFRLIWEPLFLNKTKKNIMSCLPVGDSTTIYWKTSLSMSCRGSISSIFSSNSEALASELLENLDEMFLITDSSHWVWITHASKWLKQRLSKQ